MPEDLADPRTPLLADAMAAIGPADWPRLQDAIGRARAAGLPRGDLEETLLQAVLFFGFPRVVTAFEQLVAAWPGTAAATAAGGVPPGERQAKGEALFGAIYGANATPVRAMLDSFHPEFHAFVLEAAYGRILARPGLDPRTRELLAVTALAVLDQIPQLVAHARGARNFGADRRAIAAALAAADVTGEQIDRLLRRIGVDH